MKFGLFRRQRRGDMGRAVVARDEGESAWELNASYGSVKKSRNRENDKRLFDLFPDKDEPKSFLDNLFGKDSSTSTDLASTSAEAPSTSSTPPPAAATTTITVAVRTQLMALKISTDLKAANHPDNFHQKFKSTTNCSIYFFSSSAAASSTNHSPSSFHNTARDQLLVLS